MKTLINFINKIDCKFPYSNEKKSHEVITEARDLWLKAILYIVYEIMNVPASMQSLVDDDLQLSLLNHFKDDFHAYNYDWLYLMLVTKIRGIWIPDNEIINRMFLALEKEEWHILLALLYSIQSSNSMDIENQYERIKSNLDN